MSGKFTKEICIVLLREKADELRRSGEDRLPRRSDFPDGEVSAIKAFLGPWPRALEAAGLKEKRDDGKAERIREKRIRAKIRRTEAKKQNSFKGENHEKEN